MNLNQVTLPATDFSRSVAFYRAMGFTLIVHSPPRYARFDCPVQDSTFSLHSVADSTGDTGVVVYFECSDLDDRVERVSAAGFEFTQLPTDERWLWREARLIDSSGNVICLFWAETIARIHRGAWRPNKSFKPSPNRGSAFVPTLR